MGNGLGFRIGNFLIPYYGLMIVAGIFFAVLLGWILMKKHQKNFDDFLLMAAVCGLCGIIGAKLLYLVLSADKIDFSRLLDLKYLNAVMSGGFVFYGGLIGGFAGLLICRKVFKLDVMELLNLCIACIPIVHGFGRIGCGLVGCCYGCPYDGPGAILYRNSLFAPNKEYLFPVQFTEAAVNFSIAIVLLLLAKKLTGSKGIELYLILYAVMRFVLEFFRYDDVERGMLFGISTSQYISIGILVLVAVYHFRKKAIQARQ